MLGIKNFSFLLIIPKNIIFLYSQVLIFNLAGNNQQIAVINKGGFGGDIIFAKKVPKDLIKNKKGIYILFRPKRLKINEF